MNTKVPFVGIALSGRVFLILSFSLHFITCAVDAQSDAVFIKGQPAHPTRLLAKLKNPIQAKSLNTLNLLKTAGITVQHQYRLVPGLVLLEPQVPQVSLMALPTSPGKPNPKEQAQQLQERIAALEATGLFEYVEPDYIAQLDATPNDSAFVDGTLWALRNLGQNGGAAGVDIEAVKAWNITTGSTEVIVAVIDTGIRYTHHDLAANMWRNPGEIPGNGIDDDGDGYVDNVYGINAINGSGDPMDDYGHGTHVAGTIGAVANDGNPHIGVAWNVKLMACKAGSASGSFKISDVIKCIDFAVDKGAHVLNNSWAGGPYSKALFDSIARANDLGILFIAAAGNDTNNNDAKPVYPASYPLDNIISVAAIDRHGDLASFSNYGRNSVHLAAPGTEIFSCWNGSDTDYKTSQGTSMAAPHVTGIAALVLSRYPGISVTDMRRIILNSAVPMPALQGKTITGGRVNAFNALNAVPDGNLEITLQPPPDSTLLAGSTQPFVVSVSDVGGVKNATVTGNIVGYTNLTFNNAGMAPDAVANDENYSAFFAVPPFSDTMVINLSVTAPGKNSTNLAVAYEVVAPAVNDAFTKRTLLPSVTNVTVTGANIHATREPGEPYHIGHTNVAAGGKSVWWSWTAPAKGFASIDTTGSDFDTLLAIYTGTTVTSLTPIASNDDASYSTNNFTSSLVTFDVVAGTSYQIAVDGFGGASGNIRLHLQLVPPYPAPANDNFQNRTTLPNQFDGEKYQSSAQGLTFGATKQVGEPNHAGNQGGRSIWYSWTAPISGSVDLTTDGSNFDTLLAVYTGSTVSSLTTIASNDDEGSGVTTSRVGFQAVAGTTYQIAVDGFDGAIGVVQLGLTLVPTTTGPANDLFQNATQISGTSLIGNGSNIGATKENGEPNHADNAGGSSVWWFWTAPVNGLVTITTAGSSFDTLLAVYIGSSVDKLALVASNDDDPAGGNTSRISFYTFSGTTYRIAVDGYRNLFGNVASGSITLKLVLDTGSRPANDDFANRIVLVGATITANGSNIGGSKEAGEPTHPANVGGRSVWWSWVAPASGQFIISTSGSDFDTLLAVYTGSSIPTLVIKASNDDNPNGGKTSLLSFNALAGTTYQIAVDGVYGASGQIALNISQQTSLSSIYWTQFAYADGYRTSYPSLAGQNGWTNWGSGGNGILTNNFPGFGQQAYVGHAPPSFGVGAQNLMHPINFVPDLSSGQVVKFSVLMKIVDSTGWLGPWDHFRWSFYNSERRRLFAVDFDNNIGRKVSYLLDDSKGFHNTGVQFVNDAVHKLEVYARFSENVWSATLDGIALTPSLQPITTVGAALNMADVDAVWALTTLNNAGDNYMVFDNYTVELITPLYAPTVQSQPQSQSVAAGANVNLSLTATGTGPLSYQWFHDRVAIPNVTTAVLTLSNVQTNQAGRYWVRISNAVGSVTSQEVVLLVQVVIPPPANDQFANRARLAGTSNLVVTANIGATKEPTEPNHAGNIGGKSVWWTWTAPVSSKVTISTVGSDFDTLLGVYTGSTLSGLRPVGGNDDAQSLLRGSLVAFQAIANTAYQIAVDGFNGDEGTVRLSIKPGAAPQFSQAIFTRQTGFQFAFSGEQGLRFSIETSSNLVDWVALTHILNSDGVVNYLDATVSNANIRFYRIKQEP